VAYRITDGRLNWGSFLGLHPEEAIIAGEARVENQSTLSKEVLKTMESKYGHLYKKLSFTDLGPGFCRQGARMSSEQLGLDVNVDYGAYWTAGKMGREPYGPHIHDFNQVMIFMGADMSDPGYLGAEIEFCLGAGQEMEKHMIATSTAVLIPKALPHFPATITRMDKRFLFMVISIAREWKATPVAQDRNIETIPVAGWGSKYRNKILPLAFIRNGPWHYGPLNRDTHDGAITNIIGQEFPFNMSYESVRKAPYRFGPVPDKPHSHDYDEFALMLGADTDDLTELGAEFETGMGAEIENLEIKEPSATVFPKGFPHGPGAFLKIHKPMIFAIIRPFVSGGTTKH
jgi:hypothetical protein